MPGNVQLQEAFKLALSMTLFYWLALAMDWDLPKFGALAIVIISLSTTGASLNKGFMRVAGTALGALAGFVLLSWFAQSPLGMYLAAGLYLVFTGYFLQISRQGDTWFNAGFLAIAVWSSSYLKVDTAFDFAVTRFLETAAGVLLFSVIAALLWPRTSAAALQQLGQSVWSSLGVLFTAYRRGMTRQPASDDTVALRSRLAGEYQQFLATLDAAYADTPAVGAQKRAWEILRVRMRTFAMAQDLWHESMRTCDDLDLPALLPGLAAALDTLEQRLQRGRQLWETRPEKASLDQDADLLQPLALGDNAAARERLTHAQQAALMNFAAQLSALDRSSREMLQTLRVLAGIEPHSTLAGYHVTDPYRPSGWNPERLVRALFPAACWTAGYAFWYFINPPGGPAIPMMCAAFGLTMVMAPVPLFGLLIVLLLSMFVAVAPIYLLIMPSLENGYALLILIFLYTLFFGYLGGKSPVLKLGPLAMFVMMVDINNNQVYSFIALATAGLVMLMGVSIVLLVQRLLSPMHPEHIMMRSVQRFLRGAAGIIRNYRVSTTRDGRRAARQRKRAFENTVLPIAAQLLTLQKSLDYHQFPDNPPDKVQQLVDDLQAVRLRLLSLEATYVLAEAHAAPLLQQLSDFTNEWRQRISTTLLHWSRFDFSDAPALVGGRGNFSESMEQVLTDLQQQGTLISDPRALYRLYAVMGSAQSLLDAMGGLQDSLRRLNWPHWAEARF